MKILTALAAAIASAMGSAPSENMKRLVLVSAAFVVLDTAIGFLAAVLLGRVASRSMYRMLVSKLLQYALLIIVCAGASLLAQSYALLMAGIYFIIYTEFVSMVETMVRLQRDGVNMGPAKPLLNRLSKYFAGGIDTSDSTLTISQKVDK